MAGISTITGSFLKFVITWNCQNTVTGTDYPPIGSASTINKQLSFTTALVNNVSGGADEFVSYQFNITAGSSSSVDFTSLTNILNQTSTALVRVKGYAIRLMSTSDDTTNGTAASSIGVGLNGALTAATPLNLELGTQAGSGLTVDTTTVANAITAVVLNGAGTGYPKSSTFAVLVLGAGAGGVIAATTNSSGVVTAVRFITGAGGTGYSDATAAATVPLSYYQLNNGGCHMHTDPSAAGMATVDSTHKILRIVNNDGAVTANVQLTIFGAQS